MISWGNGGVLGRGNGGVSGRGNGGVLGRATSSFLTSQRERFRVGDADWSL